MPRRLRPARAVAAVPRAGLDPAGRVGREARPIALNRRRFLALLGLVSLGAVASVPMAGGLALGAAPTTVSAGRLYRGDRTGRIYVSHDQGTTWQLHTYLGPELKVERLVTDRTDRVHATIGYVGRAFELVLAADQRSWLTV